MKAWRSKELAKKLSILRQTNTISMQITVKELVEFGRFPYTKGKLTIHDQQIVKESMEHLGLDALGSNNRYTLWWSVAASLHCDGTCPRYRLYFVG